MQTGGGHSHHDRPRRRLGELQRKGGGGWGPGRCPPGGEGGSEVLHGHPQAPACPLNPVPRCPCEPRGHSVAVSVCPGPPGTRFWGAGGEGGARPGAAQARKTTKTMKKTMRMRKILTSSQRLEVTDWKYLRISPCAASTFSCASSTLASILGGRTDGQRGKGGGQTHRRDPGGAGGAPLDRLLLLLHHVRQLLEDGAQLHDGGLDVLHRVRPALDVGILQEGGG